jgi:hypothetical protein
MTINRRAGAVFFKTTRSAALVGAAALATMTAVSSAALARRVLCPKTWRLAAGLALASLAMIVSAQSALAQGIRVACDGTPRTLDASYEFSVQTGDVLINLADDSMAGLRAYNSSNDLVAFANLRVNETFTVPASADGGIVLASTLNTLAGTAIVRCGETAPVSPAPENPTPAPTSPTAAAQTSVIVQTSVTQSAINTNIAGRFGQGAGFSANANGIVASSRGLDSAVSDLGQPDLNAWVGVEGRRYSGTTMGDSRNLSFGIDRLLSPNLVVGGFISYNDQTATVGGQTTTTQSPLFGLYAARKMTNGLFISGFAGYGRPDYTVGTTKFTATRTTLGLSVSGQFEAGGLSLTPLAGLLATREELPAAGIFAADTLENVQASLSLRAEPAQRFANGMLPYVSLAAQYNRQSSNLNDTETFTKPRIGLGVDWQLAAGNLRFDLDYGSLAKTSNDLGASLVYDFKF